MFVVFQLLKYFLYVYALVMGLTLEDIGLTYTRRFYARKKRYVITQVNKKLSQMFQMITSYFKTL